MIKYGRVGRVERNCSGLCNAGKLVSLPTGNWHRDGYNGFALVQLERSVYRQRLCAFYLSKSCAENGIGICYQSVLSTIAALKGMEHEPK